MANSARIDELRKKFDENPRRYFAPLANEYRKSGDLDQAAFILEEYLPQQPGHMSGHIVYGQTLFELGRDEEAKRVFETALTLDPENLIALRHLGHIARQAGDFDAARSWYQRLLEADPRDSEIEQLLESLDSAAQAHAASPSPSSDADTSLPPPLPPPSLSAADDSSSLQVEHVVEQEAPIVNRPTTHPLGPPPIPTPTPAIETPVVEAASEPPAEAEELLDLEDFSIGGEPAHAAASASNDSNESNDTPAPSMPVVDEVESETAASDDVDLTIVGLDDLGFDAARDEPMPVSAPETEPLLESTEPELPEHAGAAAAMDFVPFSDLPPETVDATENISGLETYTFESGEITEAEPDENLGSFFMEPTEAAPAAEAPTPATPIAAFTPVGSTPVAATTPISATPVAASTPISATPVAASTPISVTPVSVPPIASVTPTAAMHGLDDSAHDDDTFATETMAKLYMNQGHFESALGIYRTLSARNPNDEDLKRQIAEIEDRVQRRRREPTPASSIETAAPVEAMAEEPIVGATGPTIRDFLVGIIRRGVAAAPPSDMNGGSIDELFGGGGAMDDDLVAADTLARAFAPEPMREPMAGKPAREASTELSLDHVFREPGQTDAADDTSGFSFDQFFAGDLGDESSGEKAPARGEADDIEQFNAWLNGLKKT